MCIFKIFDNNISVKKIFIALLLFSILSVSAKDDPKQKKGAFKFPKGIRIGDYVAGNLIVKFKGTANGKIKTGVSASAISGLKITSGSILSISPIFNQKNSSDSYSVFKAKGDTIGLERIYYIKYSSKLSITSIINQLLENPEVEYAEPDYIYHTSYIPNDPSLPIQSHLSQIKAPEAWDVIKNSSNVVIAIVDAGSDLEHEDLAANIFINVKDPVNGIDDDNDGYIDNNRGWDFVGASATNSKQDNDPDVKNDANSHGIHVSGIASAVTDNGKGISSAAFNAKLLIVKAGADDDPESIYNGYQAIKYAADHGAQIINCSWGGAGGGSFGQDIIDYTYSKNCLVVAAAGNENTDVPEFPAAYNHVLSVTSVNSDDTRSRFHFGYDVDISAPGINIYSTFNNNTYGTLSGTSMATPLVSSAAALVKSKFPLFTMEQVGEQLRATSDNIDQKNPSFVGRLGKGRLNLFNAVTASAISIRNVNRTIVDKGSGTIPAGDTIKVFIDLKNFLSSVSGVKVTLSSSSSDAVIVNNQLDAGSFSTNELKTQIGPFNVFIKPTTEDNKKITFRLTYSANSGAYTDFELFQITAAVDYLNYHVNDIASTITSVGRVGYSDSEAQNGLGFNYKGKQLLFEGSLMVGYSKNDVIKLSNNTRNESNGHDDDFVKKVRVAQIPNIKGDFEAKSEFDDSGNSSPLGIYIKHRHLAYKKAARSKFSIVEYEVQNKTNATIDGLYLGLFTDWDIDDGGKDVTKFDLASRMGYAFGKGVGTKYAGVKLLSKTGSIGYYPMTYEVAGDPMETNGGFELKEKYVSLSSGVKALSLGDDKPNGYDIMFVTSSGPYKIAANTSVKVSFALIGGDNLADLKASADTAQVAYDNELSSEPPISTEVILKQNYPNPIISNTTIGFNIPRKGRVVLEIFNLLGKRMSTLINEEMEAGYYPYEFRTTDLDLKNGIYLYRLKFENVQKTLKMEVFRP